MPGSNRSSLSEGYYQRRRRKRRFQSLAKGFQADRLPRDESVINIGQRLRELRSERDLSLRSLAEMSGLNVNTLSLIENEKTSPNVATLQQIAGVLRVPITAFFETFPGTEKITHLSSDQRPKVAFAQGLLEDMGYRFATPGLEPYLVVLEPGADSGPTPIVHTGLEFVYCIEGRLSYTIEGNIFVLEAGSSLLFEAQLPHRWRNTGKGPSRSLLVLCPAGENNILGEGHFISNEIVKPPPEMELVKIDSPK